MSHRQELGEGTGAQVQEEVAESILRFALDSGCTIVYTTVQAMEITTEIHEHYRGTVLERAERLHRRAAKLGVPDFRVDISEPYIVKHRVWDDSVGEWEEVQKPMAKVTVIGETLKLPGFVFAARLERIEDAGTVVKVLPGQTIEERWRTAESFCDHCKTIRRRLVTYIVKDEKGTESQVGSDCLKDFTGHDLGTVINFNFDLCGMCEDLECLPPDAKPSCYGLEFYMTAVASCIRRLGFVSKKAALEYGKECTSAAASTLIFGMSKHTVKKENVPNTDDAERAKRCIAWVRESLSEKPNKSDYEHNLALIFSRDIVDFKHMGFAASAIAAWEREVGRQIERERKYQDEKGSAFQGEVGKRQVFKGLTFVYGKEIAGDWGVRTMCKFRDASGNVFIWWATGERIAYDKGTGYEQGRAYDIVGTVKKHEEYNGIKQTILSRCSVEGEWYCPQCHRLSYDPTCKFCDIPKGSWRCVNTSCNQINPPEAKKCSCGHDLKSWFCVKCATWNFKKIKICKCGVDKHGLVPEVPKEAC